MYCFVINSVINIGPISLPEKWQCPITNELYEDLNEKTDEELELIGWFPVEISTAVFDGIFEVIDEQSFLFNEEAKKVIETITTISISLDAAKEKKITIITNHLDEILVGTFEWDSQTWLCDERARNNLTGMAAAVALGATIPPDLKWRNMDGTDVLLNLTDLIAFSSAMMNFIHNSYRKYYDHLGAVELLTTVSAVVNYDHTIGW